MQVQITGRNGLRWDLQSGGPIRIPVQKMTMIEKWEWTETEDGSQLSPALLLECGAVFEVRGFGEDTGTTVSTWRWCSTRRDITLPITLINTKTVSISNNRSHSSSSFLSSLHIRTLIPSLPFTILPFQANESTKATFFSLLSSRGNSRLLFDFVQSWSTLVVWIQLMFLPEGVSQLKDKWTEYKQPKRLRRLVSLFVSATAKHVAVAAGNRITILSKEDDYQNPCAIFTSEIYLFVYLISVWNLFCTG